MRPAAIFMRFTCQTPEKMCDALNKLNDELFLKIASLSDSALSESVDAVRALKMRDSSAGTVLYLLEAEEF